MIIDKRYTIPANTIEASKLIKIIPAEAGIIHEINIIFPSGCQGLAHAKILRGQNQIAPSNSDGDFASDFETISFRENYELSAPPYQIEVHLWNLDTLYAHTVGIRVGILPKAVITPWLMTWREKINNVRR